MWPVAGHGPSREFRSPGIVKGRDLLLDMVVSSFDLQVELFLSKSAAFHRHRAHAKANSSEVAGPFVHWTC